MRRPVVFCVVAVLLLFSVPAWPAGAPSAAPPAGFSAIGAAVIVGAHGQPVFGLGYPLAEWSSLFRRGHGTFVGLISKESFGLGLGHRFEDYRSAQGEVVSFTIGPSYTLPFNGDGLRSGSIGVFAVVGFRMPRGKE